MGNSSLLATIAASIDADEDFFRNEKATGTITFATVLAGDTVTINGLVYTAVAGAKADNTEFSIDGSDTVDAADLADSIVNDARTGITDPALDVTATSSAAVVTVEETVGGTGGNSIDLASSNGARLAVSGATLTGGTTPKHNIDFSVDGAQNRCPQYLIVLCHSVEALTLKIAYDGSTFVNLGPVLVADAVNEFKIPVVTGDIINFQCASDITLRRFNVLAIYNAAS